MTVSRLRGIQKSLRPTVLGIMLAGKSLAGASCLYSLETERAICGASTANTDYLSRVLDSA